MKGLSSWRLYSLALSLTPTGWDEHQDKQGLASIGLFGALAAHVHVPMSNVAEMFPQISTDWLSHGPRTKRRAFPLSVF